MQGVIGLGSGGGGEVSDVVKPHLTRWTQPGKTSTPDLLAPASKMRILGSGTPRLKRDFG